MGILCLVPQQGNSRRSLQLHGALGAAVSSHHPAHSTYNQWQHQRKTVELLCRDGARGQRAVGDQGRVSFSLRGRKAPSTAQQSCAGGKRSSARSKSRCALPDIEKGKENVVSLGLLRIRNPAFLPASGAPSTYAFTYRQRISTDISPLRTLQLKKLG